MKQGTSPTCHDFGAVVAAADASSGGEGVIPMLVGFTGGQIQLVDPVRKELSKLYNEERLVEQSRFVNRNYLNLILDTGPEMESA